MQSLPLVWAGLGRKRVRTILTVLSVAVAFVLFGAMHGVNAGLDALIKQMSDTRLRIQSRVNISEPLPLAHLARIESVPGVLGVGYYNFFAGYYQEPRNSISAGAVDIDRMSSMFPELELSKEARDAMVHTRNGAVIGRDLAGERGWKVGDRIPLRSRAWMRKDGADEWPLEIVGIYSFSDTNIPSNELWMNYSYFDEARAMGNGTVTLYFARIDDPKKAAAIAERIDGLFANSPYETQTQNERDWIRSRINQTGNIGFFINAIIAAVMFTLLFLTGNTMMQSVRERIPELAILKTYGFSNTAVMTIVVAESLLLCVLAAALGLGIAELVWPSVSRMIGIGGMSLPLNVVGTGLAIAALVALVSALPPSWRAQRISIVNALAGR
jgi:putative ABC transport system permease protein